MDDVCETLCNVDAFIIDQAHQKSKSLFGLSRLFLQKRKLRNRHFANSSPGRRKQTSIPFVILRKFTQISCVNCARMIDIARVLFYNKGRSESGRMHAPLLPHLLHKGAVFVAVTIRDVAALAAYRHRPCPEPAEIIPPSARKPRSACAVRPNSWAMRWKEFPRPRRAPSA